MFCLGFNNMVEWKSLKVIGPLVTIVFAAIIAPIIVSQYLNQPRIHFYLEGDDTVNFEYQTLSVKLRYCNRGGIDTTIILILTVKNATIKKPDPLTTNIIYNETKTKIYVSVWKNMDHYGAKSLTILPKNSPQTFSITYNVGKNFDLGSMFWTRKPIYPTTLTYNKTDTNEYTKIIQ